MSEPSLAWRLRAGAAVAIIPPLLEVASFASIERALRWLAHVSVRGAPDDQSAARWVERKLIRLPAPWAFTCLRRAAILYFLVRSAGRAVELYIGVRRDAAGKLHAHAWLVRDGAAYLESSATPDRAADFSLIARFPQMDQPGT